MKRYLYFLLFVSVLANQQILAQKNYNKWFFGFHAGLDFNTDPPTPLSNPLIEGLTPPFYTSTISDKNGDLLFFTNGLKVWNRYQEELPKTQNRWPWSLIDEIMPLICPYPGNDTLFYIFSVGKGRGNNPNYGKLVSMTVNTAANLNTAALVYPQPTTATNFFNVHSSNGTFLLSGTSHCNQKDSWITTIANGAVENYLVTETGVSNSPVVSALPAGIQQSMLNSGYSNIRFSANGEKFAIPVVSQNKVIVYDFNNQTGACTNPKLISLPPTELLADIELSAGGTKLYYASYIYETDGPDVTGVELNNVFQLDLEAGTAAQIESSRYMLNSYPDRGGCSPRVCFNLRRTLNLGPDGRIYVSMRDVDGLELDKKVNVIEYPDKDREDASYRINFIDLGRKYKFINVSYIRSGSFSLKENGILVRKKICFGLPTEFSLLYTQLDSVKWDFGDVSSGDNNFSTDIAPVHTYPAVGIYTVKAVIFKNCIRDTASVQVSIDPDPIVHIPDFIKDTVGCIGNSLFIDAKHPAATSYLWSDGLIYSYRTIDKPGQFQVKAFNACSQDTRKFTVTFDECPCEYFVPSAFTPNNDGLNDEFKPFSTCYATEYQFQVFNKYGNVVFSSSEPGKGWKGDLNKMPAATDVFIWQLQYRNPNTKEKVFKKGTVTLIR